MELKPKSGPFSSKALTSASDRDILAREASGHKVDWSEFVATKLLHVAEAGNIRPPALKDTDASRVILDMTDADMTGPV